MSNIYINFIVPFLVLYSTIEYYCINMVLYKSINIYIFMVLTTNVHIHNLLRCIHTS